MMNANNKFTPDNWKHSWTESLQMGCLDQNSGDNNNYPLNPPLGMAFIYFDDLLKFLNITFSNRLVRLK